MTRPVLCVDPDPEARQATRRVLESAGYTVRVCESAERAIRLLTDATYACVVTEYDLPDGTGLELVDRIRDTSPDTACILFTDVPLERIDTSTLGSEVVEFLAKGEAAHDQLVDLVEVSAEARTQTAYPLPADESDRETELERYLDAYETAEISFDRLTRIASALFDVPKAAVSLIDRREQRFLDCHGGSLDAVPRQETVCTYAMLEDGVTVVQDTREDPRFADNAGLAELDIRFYASANISDGEHVLGTFCIYDETPREFDDAELDRLRLLADEAMERLELRRRLHRRDPPESEGRDSIEADTGDPS